MRMTSSKDINYYLSSLLQNGWQYTGTNKHIKLLSPNNVIVFVSKTPSDRKTLLNLKKVVRHVQPK